MSASETMAERHRRILARLSELALGLAEKVQADAMAADEPKAAAQAAASFHRIARSVRQTVALEARLQRDQAREARETEQARCQALRTEKAQAIAGRRAALSVALRDDIREVFHLRREDKFRELEERLDALEALDGFEAGDVEDLLGRLREDLRFHEAHLMEPVRWSLDEDEDDEDEDEADDEGDGPEDQSGEAPPVLSSA